MWEDTHLQETQGGRYAKQESFVVDDIYTIGHSPCHVEILEQFQVKAYMIAPIFYQDKLWGLLGAYQNSSRRSWQEEELQVLKQIGTQLGVALQQIQYNRQLEETSQQVAKQAQRERAVAKLVPRILQSRDEAIMFRLATDELRHLLNCDRVGVYRFTPDWSGEFVSESVASGWVPLV
ncbi:GAF domain-containing protein, partial [Leptolyngbya sp. CCY15150]|uniref:GAF domain-containing protein n=1 Tax=Leptolyngbya sp. CCY15150 TaxID=2767772 RepID=UPI00194DE323